MKKFQIFLFIEACLLTGSSDFDGIRAFFAFSADSIPLLLLLRYYTGKEGNNVFLLVTTILSFFIVMLNPFVILAIFVAVIYSLFLLYPMMNQEREETDLVFEEVVTVKMNAILGLVISIISLVTRPASLTISTSFASWARTPFI